jgi:hypothetical protein
MSVVANVSWFSQAFPPDGASTAEGIRNQLGRPRLDPLTILVRESAQNSWDARLPDSRQPVDYAIDLRTISPSRAPTWRALLSRNAPGVDHLPLRKSLGQPTLRVLTVSDRGTSGLGGPTRADQVVTEDHDFVSFVRNIGEPRDTELGGGTYGFGKAIFYLLSKAGTILIHTRCRVDGRLESRLMACALWQSYVAGGVRYTGRHWWGDTSHDVVEPLIGSEADRAAAELGLEPFDNGATGTTIVVLDPDLGDRDPHEAATYLAETIAWHLWPKMLDLPTREQAMRYSVTCDGIEYPVPDPMKVRGLELFVRAYQDLESENSRVVQCLRPKKRLGRLGLARTFSPPIDPTPVTELLGIEQSVHHVCLMRQAELVVTYRPGPKPPNDLVHYAGVFRADADVDQVYASAEPPTHDDWNPQSLDYPDSTYVNTTFRRINDATEEFLELKPQVEGTTAEIPLGAASTMFASLVGSARGTGGATDFTTSNPTGARPPSGASASGNGRGGPFHAPVADNHPVSGNNGSGRFDDTTVTTADPSTTRRGTGDRLRVEYVGDPYFDDRSGNTVLIQEFRLPSPGPQCVHADLAVVLTTAGGRETDPPVGAEKPVVIGWQDDSGELHTVPFLVAEGGTGKLWRLVVRPARDTMTEIIIRAETV